MRPSREVLPVFEESPASAVMRGPTGSGDFDSATGVAVSTPRVVELLSLSRKKRGTF